MLTGVYVLPVLYSADVDRVMQDAVDVSSVPWPAGMQDTTFGDPSFRVRLWSRLKIPSIIDSFFAYFIIYYEFLQFYRYSCSV